MAMGLLDVLRKAAEDNHTPTEFDFDEPSLQQLLRVIDEMTPALLAMQGRPPAANEFMLYVKPLLDLEKPIPALESTWAKWRLVIENGKGADGNHLPVNIQICNGPPRYDRINIDFLNNHVQCRISTECVTAKPDLNHLMSTKAEGPSQCLASLKAFYDNAQVHRVAVLGAARVFPHLAIPEQDGMDGRPATPPQPGAYDEATALRGQAITQRVVGSLDQFLDVMEDKQVFTVNGGWAGSQEGSTGLPLISSVIGAVADADRGHSLPPLTIMPSGGAFDRVVTRADVCQVRERELQPYLHTYYEVEGTWGDDSKYLVGVSTALMVFEPYGFWTNIEIANGVAQQRPVAVIADPAKLQQYPELMDGRSSYAEVPVPLPDGGTGMYRVYVNAAEASMWLEAESSALMVRDAALAAAAIEVIPSAASAAAAPSGESKEEAKQEGVASASPSEELKKEDASCKYRKNIQNLKQKDKTEEGSTYTP